MRYITIDGDDIGQKITSCYLRNDLDALSEINKLVRTTTSHIAEFLQSQDFTVIFCAADGVAAYSSCSVSSDEFIFQSIRDLSANGLTFSIGVGSNLRESYIALLFAKSSGKECLRKFQDIG